MKINPAYKLLVVSTSTIYGSEFLEYIKHDFVEFIQSDELLFIPFARPSGISFDTYTAKVQEALTDKGELDLIQQLRVQIAKGIPYVGTSAGSNLTGLTIGTTNDMPIVYPPSFDALGFLPFNINPHYLDPDPKSTHRGETRETRIKEFHQLNTQPVIGLREGSWLHVNDGKIQLQGDLAALLFRPGLEPVELAPGLINF